MGKLSLAGHRLTARRPGLALQPGLDGLDKVLNRQPVLGPEMVHRTGVLDEFVGPGQANQRG